MSPDTYNCRLNTANIFVSLINVLLPAIDWILYNHKKYEAFLFDYETENICLVFSCVILVWGFKKLISLVRSDQHLVNKGMIIWHIIAYFFIVIATFCSGFFNKTPKQYEISECCLAAINLACNVILALIVNQICTKAF